MEGKRCPFGWSTRKYPNGNPFDVMPKCIGAECAMFDLESGACSLFLALTSIAKVQSCLRSR